MHRVETLNEFYKLMKQTCLERRKIVARLYAKKKVPMQFADTLGKALLALESIQKKDGNYCLKLDETRNICLNLDYEIKELQKDLFFIEHTEDKFLMYLNEIHDSFSDTVSSLVKNLRSYKFTTLITDRDGTVNNYCGRYISSVQSIYNALFLSRFAARRVTNAVILTSAPLDNIGLVDISVAPERLFIYAGSKGREYFDRKGKRRQFPIEDEKQNILNKLNERLSALVKRNEYEKFALIGSGLQFKFGQTTLARQDISNTIPQEESLALIETIKGILRDIDPDNEHFRIEDTGKDIEIILTIKSSEGNQSLKDFDKGDGIAFLNSDVPLHLAKGASLVCGDTASDVPMVVRSLQETETVAVFVTRDEALREKVQATGAQSFFVPEPDMLVAALNELARH